MKIMDHANEIEKDSFECILTNKNPHFNDKFALMFKFKPVMNESGYMSNKALL